jgi:outer membrane protein
MTKFRTGSLHRLLRGVAVRAVLGAGMLAAPLAAKAQSVAPAAPFFATGSILARARFAAVIPQNFSSSVSVIGGHVDATTAYIPELDLSYFITPHIAIEAIAGTSRHEVSAQGSLLGPKVDLGSVWALPPTVTVQYHQQYGNFIPYAGVGLSVVFFYDSHPNVTGGITKVGYDTGVGPTLDAGFDYVLSPHWVANVDVKQMFVNTTAHINGVITAKTALSPTVVAAGIGYRF